MCEPLAMLESLSLLQSSAKDESPALECNFIVLRRQGAGIGCAENESVALRAVRRFSPGRTGSHCEYGAVSRIQCNLSRAVAPLVNRGNVGSPTARSLVALGSGQIDLQQSSRLRQKLPGKTSGPAGGDVPKAGGAPAGGSRHIFAVCHRIPQPPLPALPAMSELRIPFTRV